MINWIKEHKHLLFFYIPFWTLVVVIFTPIVMLFLKAWYNLILIPALEMWGL